MNQAGQRSEVAPNAGRGDGSGPCILAALIAVVTAVSAVQAQPPEGRAPTAQVAAGDDGPAVDALLHFPTGVAVHDGHLYIGDLGNHRIRRVDAVTGEISTVAGSGTEGFSGDGGPATRADISNPFGLVVHPDGDLLIGDSFNQRIRRLDRRTGVIETIAGTGEQGTGGDGGPAADAAFVFFGELAVDPRGRLLLSGVGNHTVRAIDLDTGVITRIAGTGRWDFGGDGGPALDAHFHLPYSLDVDDEGNVYVADFWNWRVRRIDATSGTVSTVAGGVPPPEGTEHYHFHHQEPSGTGASGSPVPTVPTGAGAAQPSSEVRAGPERFRFVRLLETRDRKLLAYAEAAHVDALDAGGR